MALLNRLTHSHTHTIMYTSKNTHSYRNREHEKTINDYLFWISAGSLEPSSLSRANSGWWPLALSKFLFLQHAIIASLPLFSISWYTVGGLEDQQQSLQIRMYQSDFQSVCVSDWCFCFCGKCCSYHTLSWLLVQSNSLAIKSTASLL